MRLVTTIAAVGLAATLSATLGAGSALAAPTPAMLQPAVDTGAVPTLELVRGGCGFGEHRGFYGRCRYNRGWRGYIRYRRNHWRWRHYY